jgi:hypothetical protein
MALTEQELRHQLEAAAGQALPPRFAVTDVAGRIRRQRAKNTWAVSGCVAAVAALAVAIPLGLVSRANPGTGNAATGMPGSAKLGAGRGGGIKSGPESVPPPRLRLMQFAVTVNGQRPSIDFAGQTKAPYGCGKTPADACPASLGPGFTVTPGERLSIRVLVTIPRRARVTDLWLGISRGSFGSNRTGPIGQQPILAHIRNGLEPGRRTFRIDWTVPDETKTGTVLWLAASWTGMLPLAGSAGSQEPLVSASISASITVFVAR